MRIGELGDRAGVNPKTIRYYEEVGLMPPPGRSPAGYREYDADAADRLRFIKAAQSVSLSLGEIREILALRDRGEEPCAHVLDLLEARAAELAGRIAALQAMQSDLDGLVRRARRMKPSEGARYCHIIESGASRN
ncbi:MAG: heavy metal-responsive transcriptional regulator [Actinomycetota bacterium]